MSDKHWGDTGFGAMAGIAIAIVAIGLCFYFGGKGCERYQELQAKSADK